MTNAIEIRGLSKQYRLGRGVTAHGDFRELLASWFRSPLRRRVRSESSASVDLFWALNDVSFSVERGQAVGVIGKNGAGKSTLLKLLCRIATPTRGEIEYRGRMAGLLEVGTGFHPELTGRENVFLNGAILGMKRREIQEKLDRIVEFAEVENFLDTPVKRYSSGMLVRLAFSVSAHIEPDILIVDEVLAVGDVAFQRKCLRKLRELVEGGTTVLFVSHSMDTVQSLTSKCLYLEFGELKYYGDTPRAIDLYLAANRSDGSITGYGDGRVTITHLEAELDAANRDSMDIRMTVRCHLQRDVEVFRLDFSIENDRGIELIHYMAPPETGIEGAAGTEVEFRYRVAAGPLGSGEYLITLSGYVNRGDLVTQTNKIPLLTVPRPVDQYGGLSQRIRPMLNAPVHSEARVLSDGILTQAGIGPA